MGFGLSPLQLAEQFPLSYHDSMTAESMITVSAESMIAPSEALISLATRVIWPVETAESQVRPQSRADDTNGSGLGCGSVQCGWSSWSAMRTLRGVHGPLFGILLRLKSGTGGNMSHPAVSYAESRSTLHIHTAVEGIGPAPDVAPRLLWRPGQRLAGVGLCNSVQMWNITISHCFVLLHDARSPHVSYSACYCSHTFYTPTCFINHRSAWSPPQSSLAPSPLSASFNFLSTHLSITAILSGGHCHGFSPLVG